VLGAAGGAHDGATLWAQQDAHGPVRRGVVLVGCETYFSLLQAVIPGSPQLGIGAQFLNLPPFSQACPTHIQPTTGTQLP
jgi:hypothetical protein